MVLLIGWLCPYHRSFIFIFQMATPLPYAHVFPLSVYLCIRDISCTYIGKFSVMVFCFSYGFVNNFTPLTLSAFMLQGAYVTQYSIIDPTFPDPEHCQSMLLTSALCHVAKYVSVSSLSYQEEYLSSLLLEQTIFNLFFGSSWVISYSTCEDGQD